MSQVEAQKVLNEALQKEIPAKNKKRRFTPSPPIPTACCSEEELIDESTFGKSTQWTTCDGRRFFPAGKTLKPLIPGVYEIKFAHDKGYFLELIQVKTEGLIRFPDSESEKVITEIQNFWTKKKIYADYGLSYKRGIILWGPPGSGKSCTIQIVMADVIERRGVVFKFNTDPSSFHAGIRIFREIQPDTAMVVLMEDIDALLEEYGESEVLNLLDGVDKIENVVFLATTNYPEKLGARIINRPSRFDKRFLMPHPNKVSRKIYFEYLKSNSSMVQESVKKRENDILLEIDKWVKDTEGFSIAHLKELFIGVCILGDSYQDILETLKIMNEEKPKSSDTDSPMGFVS